VGDKRYSEEFVRQAFESKSYVLLAGQTYLNKDQKLSCICPNGHQIEKSYSSIRVGKECYLCRGNYRRNYTPEQKQEKLKQKWKRKQQKIKEGRKKTREVITADREKLLIAAGVDTSICYLGKLCVREHHWNGLDLTLRDRKGNKCPQCRRENARNRDKVNPLTGENAFKKSVSAYQKKHRQKNNERIKKEKQEYYKSPQGKEVARRAKAKRRALKRQVMSDLTTSQVKEVMSRINQCAYCGNLKNLTIDHVIPLSKGGLNTISNVLPACLSCNASKNNRDVLNWYKSQPFYSEERVLKYLSDHLKITLQNITNPTL
jgi:5-methylcytosine-specific restriction endonuclease McrA